MRNTEYPITNTRPLKMKLTYEHHTKHHLSSATLPTTFGKNVIKNAQKQNNWQLKKRFITWCENISAPVK